MNKELLKKRMVKNNYPSTNYVIDLGKIDYEDVGKKVNKVTIEVTLKYNSDDLPVLTMSGNIWNARNTDIISGGQNIDEIADIFATDKRVQNIWEIWNEYHLNDLKAGTPEQENVLKRHATEYVLQDKRHYKWAIDLLTKYDIYEHNGYKYGTSWLYKEIPENILKQVCKGL